MFVRATQTLADRVRFPTEKMAYIFAEEIDFLKWICSIDGVDIGYAMPEEADVIIIEYLGDGKPYGCTVSNYPAGFERGHLKKIAGQGYKILFVDPEDKNPNRYRRYHDLKKYFKRS